MKLKSPKRPLSLVKIDDKIELKFRKIYEKNLGKGPYIFFGEIPNMPEHCVVVDTKTGKISSGFHTDNFVELTDDEV